MPEIDQQKEQIQPEAPIEIVPEKVESVETLKEQSANQEDAPTEDTEKHSKIL
jgi:hypothetical protein